MLRRDLREIYNSFAPTQEQKDSVMEALLEERSKGTEMKGKKWRARGQAGPWIGIILAIMLFLGAVCYAAYHYGLVAYVTELFATEPSALQDTNPDAAEPSSQESVPTQTEAQQLSYQPLIAKYVEAIQESWDFQRCTDEDISYMVIFMEKPEDLGYALTDLDDNGIQELIITDGNVIFDLYTCVDGEYKHLLSGAERNSYSLTADKMIVNVRSGSAANSVYTFSMYYGGYLIPVELLVCDAAADPSNPWFRGVDNPEEVKPVTEQEARDIIAMYPPVQITCSPITAYD